MFDAKQVINQALIGGETLVTGVLQNQPGGDMLDYPGVTCPACRCFVNFVALVAATASLCLFLCLCFICRDDD